MHNTSSWHCKCSIRSWDFLNGRTLEPNKYAGVDIMFTEYDLSAVRIQQLASGWWPRWYCNFGHAHGDELCRVRSGSIEM